MCQACNFKGVKLLNLYFAMFLKNYFEGNNLIFIDGLKFCPLLVSCMMLSESIAHLLLLNQRG